jgi:hypothetical protein
MNSSNCGRSGVRGERGTGKGGEIGRGKRRR